MSLKKREPVTSIMTTQPFSVNVTQSLEDVEDLLNEHSIRHIPVVAGDKLVGMISRTDLERISFVTGVEGNRLKTEVYKGYTIEQVMTKSVQTVDKADTVKDAAEVLSFGAFHAVPVVDNKKLIGIVTTTDLINYLLDQY
ncbi:MAG: CBS domain-containing protein [Saprospiraceae bacterium]|nr:CBS domain-containing protein [Saprospiraceae bacterium]